ncbi:MAG: winged helix DNA-binding protein [Solirubrobacterales bacterium]|mgnify:CR=1 FL=1|nr:winged helix DNA-binding protein [Solirubrobacterales bacterium]HRV59974.1 winged helix DNA-binding protein [Solirubrobacterales bacterium]
MTNTGAIETGETNPADAAAAGQELIDNASPEAVKVALQLGTLFRRMLSYGAATTALLEADAHGLSFLEFKTLMGLGVFESQANFCLADISGSTGASMPAVSRAVDSLVRKGLVSRVEDPDDRRRRLVSLTDKGHEVTNAALMGRAVGAVKLATSFTGEELQEIDSLLSRLIEREDLASIHQQLEGAVHQ